MRVTLRPVDLEALQALAEEQYRTPEQQAAFLLARVLAEAGRTIPPPTNTQARLQKRAAELRQNED